MMCLQACGHNWICIWCADENGLKVVYCVCTIKNISLCTIIYQSNSPCHSNDVVYFISSGHFGVFEKCIVIASLVHPAVQFGKCVTWYWLIPIKSKTVLLSPVSTTRVDGWPVSITRQHGPCWRVMETGYWRPVNSASGNTCPSTRVNG